MDWIFNGKPFNWDDYKDHFGYVYVITNLKTNQKYIGRKYFKAKKVIQKNLKKSKISVESNWRSYWGSSDKLKQDIETFGKENFKREILAIGKTIGVVNYLEVHLQFYFNVLMSNDYINDNIGGKYFRDLISTYPEKT